MNGGFFSGRNIAVWERQNMRHLELANHSAHLQAQKSMKSHSESAHLIASGPERLISATRKSQLRKKLGYFRGGKTSRGNRVGVIQS
jgi:hypothetical protein